MPKPARKHILVVDDDDGILDAVEMLLAEIGFKVTVLKQASELLVVLETKRPDLILLDLSLSGSDGGALSRQLKQQPSTKKIPVIIMSAHTDIAAKSSAAAADAYIKKPFDIEDLEQLINSLLQ